MLDADHEIVDVVAIDVASRSSPRPIRGVFAVLPLTVNPLLPLSEARSKVAGKFVLAEDHIRLARVSAAQRGREGVREDDVPDSIVVDIACAADAGK